MSDETEIFIDTDERNMFVKYINPTSLH